MFVTLTLAGNIVRISSYWRVFGRHFLESQFFLRFSPLPPPSSKRYNCCTGPQISTIPGYKCELRVSKTLLMVYLTLILDITLAARSPFVGPTISHSSRLAWLVIFIFIFFPHFFWLQLDCHLRKGLHLLHEGGLKAPCQVLPEKV